MHSILENDGILSDPYEVLCRIGTLIVEGRTPKIVLDSNTSCEHGEGTSKTVKPYNEGPHCSKHMSKYAKDAHRCAENNVLCIRYRNLRQHLQYLHRVSPSVTLEVSLGPDCLCGELRSQSTLISTQPSKRDLVLEQWTITMAPDQGQDSSVQMSVLNVYQAVRSLLHFSQLAAWYASTNGANPAHVIYRVVVPEDATYITDDEFINHHLPTVNVNKSVSIKMSLKALPRKESIPKVFCVQHPASCGESSSSEKADLAEFPDSKSPKPSGSTLAPGSETDILESSLPLKFHGVRKKTNEVQERKRKKHITLYVSPTRLPLDACSEPEILDGMPPDLKKDPDPEFSTTKRTLAPAKGGESSKFEFKKSKQSIYSPEDLSNFVAHQKEFNNVSCNYFDQKLGDPFLLGLNGLGDTKRKCHFRTKDSAVKHCADSLLDKKSIMDILDDRMQISCAISGKHHCKWECDEEPDLASSEGAAEKPKRRRSLSRAVPSEAFHDQLKGDGLDFDKVSHGKFKHIQILQETKAEDPGCKKKVSLPSCSKTFPSDALLRPNTGSTATKSLPLANPEQGHDLLRGPPPKNEEMPSTWVKKETLEAFKKGCAIASSSFALAESASGEDEDPSETLLESSNPFMAAILRTTRKAKPLETPCLQNRDKTHPKPKQLDPEDELPANYSLSEDSPEPEHVKNPFKYFLLRKTGPEFQGKDIYKKSKLLEKLSSPDKPSFNFKSARRKSTAVKGPKDLNLEESPKRSPAFTKDLHSTIVENNLILEGNKEPGKDSPPTSYCHTKTIPVPSAHDKLRFRRSLDTAAQLVFHRCSGLPLTSSPAPLRRNNNSFSFDSSLNSVSAIKSALFEPANSLSSEDENESEGSLKSPASPGAWSLASKQINYHSLSPLPLLGSFEESVLNGRLEPVSTVQGFTAELGASGSFCPRHLYLPVTVFFYTLGDNDKVSAPYLGHINLGKKGYSVPRSGTIQVTLFNPLRTVVKMFVVVYDLTDMPANSHTFLRQRTLYVPASQKESVHTDRHQTPFDQEDYHKYLRYLIHLRFVSGKTGRIYLHTDIRMVIFRKADEDTATALGNQVDGETYELRSHTHGPMNPKFSPRK